MNERLDPIEDRDVKIERVQKRPQIKVDATVQTFNFNTSVGDLTVQAESMLKEKAVIKQLWPSV